jgi:hypothetical protein
LYCAATAGSPAVCEQGTLGYFRPCVIWRHAISSDVTIEVFELLDRRLRAPRRRTIRSRRLTGRKTHWPIDSAAKRAAALAKKLEAG